MGGKATACLSSPAEKKTRQLVTHQNCIHALPSGANCFNIGGSSSSFRFRFMRSTARRFSVSWCRIN